MHSKVTSCALLCLPVFVDGEELRVQDGQTELTHTVPVEGTAKALF